MANNSKYKRREPKLFECVWEGDVLIRELKDAVDNLLDVANESKMGSDPRVKEVRKLIKSYYSIW